MDVKGGNKNKKEGYEGLCVGENKWESLIAYVCLRMRRGSSPLPLRHRLIFYFFSRFLFLFCSFLPLRPSGP
ncbi:hypothetical protein TRSC58_07347 [Trypanosoma rangeli SC58]|uniref:Uncharacterized protein n=1 Tax=Trypanosoma rangeli SC58 TaxID=429131 RepID=A0A061IVK9_TRYRA|nr:hypothetical protein TRSC58_07347 [Trypanosoma rangeli SC58]